MKPTWFYLALLAAVVAYHLWFIAGHFCDSYSPRQLSGNYLLLHYAKKSTQCPGLKTQQTSAACKGPRADPGTPVKCVCGNDMPPGCNRVSVGSFAKGTYGLLGRFCEGLHQPSNSAWLGLRKKGKN
ncbi:uncharacterized protein LOC142568330 isoform X2 [Dermacentor variabilis]|uniref:uncharacterized protein LOC142568330 isoform X2 n=1 Tax=Dermacentor variabilis TaxID=34621 RepID=UPI003F5C2DBC